MSVRNTYCPGRIPPGTASQKHREAWADLIEHMILWCKHEPPFPDVSVRMTRELAFLARMIRGEMPLATHEAVLNEIRGGG